MKMLKRIFLSLIGLGLMVLLIIGSLIYSGTKKTPVENADTMIILGAQVRGNPAVPSAVLQERLDAAIPYLERNFTTQVIVTGGKGPDETSTEASVMADYLVKKGIAAERIKEESQSTNTKENLKNAKKMADLGKTVIVTSDFHLYRGLLLAKREDITASGLPAVSRSSATFKSYLRELIALPYGILFAW
ncbi:YdcF family protein [Carnobacterium gallinarum]|uniref:YdcF family protein n=1 Tax=Carnobacterium gallinarum TaxID=2749 RepID=UPI0005511A7A|nr:YdcF family protein [Carnobacterium gallinarum]